MDQALLNYPLGFLEGLGQIPLLEVKSEGHIVRPLRMDDGRAGSEGLLGIRDHWERLIVHFDQIQSIPRRIAILSDHHNHSFADKTNFIPR